MLYSAGVLYESCRQDDGPSLWELSVFLVNADNEEDAKKLAGKIAISKEESYKAAGGGFCSWKFKKLIRIFELFDSVANFDEIFSLFLTESEAMSIQKGIS